MGNQTDFEALERSANIRRRVLRAVTYTLLTLWGLMVLFPFYWMVLT